MNIRKMVLPPIVIAAVVAGILALAVLMIIVKCCGADVDLETLEVLEMSTVSDEKNDVAGNAAGNDFSKNDIKADAEVDVNRPMLALTFDDGPYAPVTERILEKLEKYHSHATFFVVGNRVSDYSECVKKAVDIGCQIGNHTWDHSNLTELTSIKIAKQIHYTDGVIRYYTGENCGVVRPVGGLHNELVDMVAEKPIITWSIDTLDWASQNSQAVINMVIGNVRDGDIILMHDLYKSTADACDTIIPALIKQGYQLVTVSELAEAKSTILVSGQTYRNLY